MQCQFLLTILVFLHIRKVTGVELTFELPDNAKQCFHEAIQQGEMSTVEFQVLTGGNNDIDVTLEGPTGEVLYGAIRKQYDDFTWIADETGDYKLCFSNEFSTFTHKQIYVDFNVGTEKSLPGIGDHLTALTNLENSSVKVHERLNAILDYQKHHRLMETQGRKRVDDLNSRVTYWSFGETFLIIFIGVGQVLILRNFFREKY